jgi:hypothetical protein
MRQVMGAVFAGDKRLRLFFVVMERSDEYHRQNGRQYNESGYAPSQRQVQEYTE